MQKLQKQSNKKELVILNAVAVIFFIVCWVLLGFQLNEETMLSSGDSQSYLDVARWIVGDGEGSSTLIRPVLYPILMGVPYMIFGVVGVWILQFACWLLAVNLTFLSVKKWSKNQLTAWISATVLILNLSFVALTFHGLAEVVTTALLSVLFYPVVSYAGKYNHVRFGVKLLLIFVALTLVKPVFYYPMLACLGFILVAHRKYYLQMPKKLVYPLLIILPILLQMTLVQVRHGDFTVSKIGGITFKDYYFAQCVREIENIDDEQESKDFVYKMNSEQRLDYVIEHKGAFAAQFVENIVLNVKSDPIFLENEVVKTSSPAYVFMQKYNLFGLLINAFGFVILAVLFLWAFFKRKKEIWIPLLCTGGLLSYFLFATGLSFWQGDRLVLPAIALWVPLYAVLFHQLGSKFLQRIKK